MVWTKNSSIEHLIPVQPYNSNSCVDGIGHELQEVQVPNYKGKSQSLNESIIFYYWKK